MVGPRDDIEVEELELDQENIDHLAKHGVKPEDALAVLANKPRFFLNPPGRGGTHVMLGPDFSGRFYYLSLVRTGSRRWRPITGWSISRRRALRLYNDEVNQ